jgi:hypothetical protein
MTKTETVSWGLGVLAGLGMIFWGVPWYIKGQVNDQFNARMERMQNSATPISASEPIVRLESRVDALVETVDRIEDGQIRAEDKLDRLYELYIQDLERRSQ